ncbi:FKBP-type peptidyl-prolyl cis-trans isomerase [Candidatus Peribacteria bacterium]|nr:FKBP-type peptidyl-prolyl cis-trans isomerase [Candidatus Peribacteria bacterium]
MKKIISLLFVSALLTSCSIPFFGKAPSTPQNGDTVSVHYVGTNDDGTEFDSSRREGRTPLEFVVGRGSMIKGFEDAVMTMKVGERKTIRLEPKDAYGEEYIEQTKPIEEYKEVVSQTVPANALSGNLEQKVPTEQAQQLFGSTEVGTEKKIGEATLKILSVSGSDVLISINDPKAPFYGKKIEVGMTTTAQDGSEITVKKIDGANIDIDIKPMQEVISKTEKEITLKVKNPHPLAGKALNFDIELLEIKPSASAQ